MHTLHRARIHAPYERVFALAQDVEGWIRLLRHYRWCHVLERHPGRVVFAMGGWIRGWPTRWKAVQEPHPADRLIRFTHIGGITTGMAVEWRFRPDGDAVAVELEHTLVMRWPLIGRLVSDLIVGPVFIDYIARRTLEAVRLAAEQPDGTAGSRASRGRIEA